MPIGLRLLFWIARVTNWHQLSRLEPMYKEYYEGENK